MKRFAVFILAGLLSLTLAGAAGADERILDFVSEVTVRPDSSLLVTETIRVRAEGRSIKRGIMREFPTIYRDKAGKKLEVGFSIQKILRDGRKEPYHTKNVSNGVQIYLGQKDHYLPRGEYTYTIVYQTTRQLGFFPEYDELYWNATGNGWTFPIDHALAVVNLPSGARIIQTAAYTGPQGAKGGDFAYRVDERGRPVWETTRPLPPHQGLTVAVAWPKGLVRQPPPPSGPLVWLAQIGGTKAGLGGLGLVLAWYLFAWFKVGRDPKKGVIIPLFQPPAGLSPAAARFVYKMGFDHKAFAAAVVSMAVKKYLVIEETDKVFTLTRTGQSPSIALSTGERKAAAALFRGNQSIELKNKNHQAVSNAIKALKTTLSSEYGAANFATNRVYLIPGALLTLLALGAMVAASEEPGAAGGISFWLLAWGAGCYFLSLRVLRAWQGASTLSSRLAAIGATLFALPFLFGAAGGIFLVGTVMEPTAWPLMLAMILLTFVFAHLLKAPTMGGRRLMDQLDGFKMYLSVAEKHRLELLHPPEKTPELFERHLPHALALGVEQQWSEQFAEVLAAAGQGGYQPIWYVCQGRRDYSFGELGGSGW